MFPPSPYSTPPVCVPQNAHSDAAASYPHGHVHDVASLNSLLQSPGGFPSPAASTGTPKRSLSSAVVSPSFNDSEESATVSGITGKSLPDSPPTHAAGSGQETHQSASMNFGALNVLLMAMSPELHSAGPAIQSAAAPSGVSSGGEYAPTVPKVVSHHPLQDSGDYPPTPQPVQPAVWHPKVQASGYTDHRIQHLSSLGIYQNRIPDARLSVKASQQFTHGDGGGSTTYSIGGNLKPPGVFERRRHSFAGATGGISAGTPSDPGHFRFPVASNLRVPSVQLQSYDLPSCSQSSVMIPTPPQSANNVQLAPRKRSIDERENQLFPYDPTTPPPDGLPDFRKRSRSFDFTTFAYNMLRSNSTLDVDSYQRGPPYMASGSADGCSREFSRPEFVSFTVDQSPSLGLANSNLNVPHSYDLSTTTTGVHHPPPASSGENIPSMPSFEISPEDRDKPYPAPRRQRSRYPGDLYTPPWVRFAGVAKEGFCDTCDPGKWLQLKNSAYWYHKQFHHGISSVSGNTFVEPIEKRTLNGGVVEGLCHQCGQWVAISTPRRKSLVLWFRHAHKCHVYAKAKIGAAMPF